MRASEKEIIAESIVAHTGQHGLDTPMTGPAPYIKHKKNRIRGMEMIQLTDNSSTICLYSECSSPAFLHSIIIAICTKVWNRVNLSIFAFSEMGTCSASIAITSLSIILIFVVLESPN